MRIAACLAVLLTTGAAWAAEPSGTLVLYTSQAPEIAQMTVEAFNAKWPGVKVEWTRNGTSQLINVLRAEIAAGDVKPDVLLVADTINLGQLKKEGRLQAYPGAPVAAYPAAVYDADKTYFGTKIIATGIGYNTNTAKPVDSWTALTLPEAKGKVAVPSPLYSGAALVHLHSLIQDPALGWAFYEGLAKNGIAPEGGNGPALKAVAGGLSAYGVITDADTLRAKAAGSPVDFIYPKEGVSFVTEPAAILSTAHNVTAAQAFIDFLLSKTGQDLVVKQGYLPADPSVAPPAGFPDAAKIKLIPLDAAKAIETDAEVRSHFTALFGG